MMGGAFVESLTVIRVPGNWDSLVAAGMKRTDVARSVLNGTRAFYIYELCAGGSVVVSCDHIMTDDEFQARFSIGAVLNLISGNVVTEAIVTKIYE